jgi:hypothetical protein
VPALACLLILVTVAALLQPPALRAQTGSEPRCRYFRRTGHHVCDPFLTFFDTRGDLEVFGYPISEPFEDAARGGLWVQYFQRARMEWHPENPAAYHVQLGLLVDELGWGHPPAPEGNSPVQDDPSHHYFPETQHFVSYAFLETFREKGGLDIFGYPRSEFMYVDGKVVQYFQRARMEWDRASPGQPVRLTNVGEMYLECFPIAPQYRLRVAKNRPSLPAVPEEPVMRGVAYIPLVVANVNPRTAARTAVPGQPPATAEPRATATSVPSAPVRELHLSASVRYPITGRTGTQTVFLYVNDQQANPVGNASAHMVAHFPERDEPCIPQPTDSRGFAWCSFEILWPTPGHNVVIDVEVSYQGLTESTQTSFMPWW